MTLMWGNELELARQNGALFEKIQPEGGGLRLFQGALVQSSPGLFMIGPPVLFSQGPGNTLVTDSSF